MKITIGQYGKILGEILETREVASRDKAIEALAKVIIRNKDQKKFSKITAMTEKLADQKNQIVRGEIFSVGKISSEGEKILTDFLQEKEQVLKKKIQAEFKEDKSLLGGLKLKIGDEVWDASWKRKLGILTENLRNE